MSPGCEKAHAAVWEVSGPPHPFRLFYTGRDGGVSGVPFDTLNLGFKGGDRPADVLENRRRVAGLAGMPLNNWVLLRQVHSDRVVMVKGEDRGAGSTDYPSGLDDADAMITGDSGVVLCVLTADCLPVALMGSGPAAALVHSGWMGTLKGLAGKVVRAMAERLGCDPANTSAWLGPGIGGCCYRVGEDRAMEFARRFDPSGVRPGEDGSVVSIRQDGCYLDLFRAVRRDLREAGIREENISEAGRCTCCDAGFFSYRRDGRTGRQAVLLWMNGGGKDAAAG